MSSSTINHKAIAAEVKANIARLDSCEHHDFQPITGSKPLFRRARCSRCGGEVDSLYVLWYDRGVEHGKKLGGAK